MAADPGYDDPTPAADIYLRERNRFLKLYDEEQARLVNFTYTIYLALFLLCLGLVTYANAHEHKPGESSEQANIVEWLRTWMRPKANFANLEHRKAACCYSAGPMQDCFTVEQTKVVKGRTFVFPQTDNPEYQKWYDVDEAVKEVNQPDPRESPDGRSYVCIVGQVAACYVGGAGM